MVQPSFGYWVYAYWGTIRVMKKQLDTLKKRLYFRVAGYFSRYAAKVLKKWNPTVIVVTGSSGKTTMLNMLEAQLGDQALFSHHANSAFGVPFHILGLKGIEGSRLNWIKRFLQAPMSAKTVKHPELIYVVEADADRPNEGKFLAELLKPQITVWVSSSRTHSMNYESLVKDGTYKSLELAIAHEYANFAKHTEQLVITDGDNPAIKESLEGISVAIKYINHEEAINDYRISAGESMVTLASKQTYIFSQPQPPVISYQVAMIDEVLKLLDVEPDYTFSRLAFPPGRSRVFRAAKDFTIVDSTYNANYDSMKAMLDMFERYPGDKKVLVLGDMPEQGENEKLEHERLADMVLGLNFKPKQVILLGPRVKKYAFEKIRDGLPTVPVSVFVDPHDVLLYLEGEMLGGEVVLFKGARFLEGVIEHLLADPQDAKYLARRGNVWRKRRAEWGL